MLHLDRYPDGFPKTLKIVGKTNVSTMVVAIDATLASSGTPGPAWDLHKKLSENLGNPCLSVFGGTARRAAVEQHVTPRPES